MNKIKPLKTGALLAAATVICPFQISSPESDTFSLRVDRGSYSLTASGARLIDVISRFSKAVGVPVHLDPKLAEQRVTLSLSARPPDRFFAALSRRIGARYKMEHVLTRSSLQERGSTESVFAAQIVNMRTNGRVPLEEALRDIDQNVKVAPGLDGRVSVFSPGLPLYRVLNNIAKQLNAAWQTSLRLDFRTPLDVEAENYERERDHFSELARLTQVERRDEIGAALNDLEALPKDEIKSGVARAAAAVVSLSTIYEQVPGEHRGALQSKLVGILSTYRGELKGRSNPIFDPLRSALAIAESNLNRAR